MARLSTAYEMHVEVLQGLQKVDAYAQQTFESEEIDLHLNKQQDRFIAELVGKEFEDKQLRLDYIRTLIVKNHVLQAYVPVSGVDLFYEPDMVYAVLPPDYLHRVNDRSSILQSTGYCRDLTSIITQIEQAEYMAVVEFPETSLTVPPYFTGFTIYKTEASIESPIYTMPAGFVGYLQDTEARFMLINNTLDFFNFDTAFKATGTKVYWERYRGMYYPNSYIFIRSVPSWTTIRIKTDTNDDPPLVGTALTVSFTSNTYKTLGLSTEDTDKKTSIAGNGMTEGDKIYDMNKNIYYRTSVMEPISAMADNMLFAYHDKSFIITQQVIDYVRKPRQISLLLNQSCELESVSARADIVDRTVQYLKLILENPNHREILQDNIIKNQNSITNG